MSGGFLFTLLLHVSTVTLSSSEEAALKLQTTRRAHLVIITEKVAQVMRSLKGIYNVTASFSCTSLIDIVICGASANTFEAHDGRKPTDDNMPNLLSIACLTPISQWLQLAL